MTSRRCYSANRAIADWCACDICEENQVRGSAGRCYFREPLLDNRGSVNNCGKVGGRRERTITKVFPCDAFEVATWVPVATSVCRLNGIKRLCGYL